eukprot:9538035-Lingulodinium_polyedra.AAC.1
MRCDARTRATRAGALRAYGRCIVRTDANRASRATGKDGLRSGLRDGLRAGAGNQTAQNTTRANPSNNRRSRAT